MVEITLTPEQQRALVETQNEIEREKQAAIAESQWAISNERIEQEKALRATQGEINPDWELDKTAGAIARGTGEGLASTADLPLQAGQWLWEVGKNAALEATGTPYTRQAVSSPLTDAYNANMPAVPEGYENVNDWAAIAGPALVETVLTAGTGTPAILAKAGAKAAAKQFAKQVPKAAVKSAYNTATGMAGGELGGLAGETVGDVFGYDELGREIGSFAGAVGGKPVTHGTVRTVGDAVLNRRPGVLNSVPGGLGVYDMLQGGITPMNTAAVATALAPYVYKTVRNPAATMQAAKQSIINSPTLADIMSASTVSRVAGSEAYQQNPLLPHMRQGGPR